jgi:ubiquinone/menaquinone biosynthesis C-methylase UbiE
MQLCARSSPSQSLLNLFHNTEMNKKDSLEYKYAIAKLYSRRSDSYDGIEWHEKIAYKLVDYADIKAGSKVLDVATGTGMVAFYVASKIGLLGSVTGVDISDGMLQIANSKLKSSGLSNIIFENGDGEALNFKDNAFDYIFCSSAFIWMTDIEAALKHWHTKLNDHGKLGFHAFSENAFVTGVIAQNVLQKYGVSYLMNKPTGTKDKCYELMRQAGFKNIDIKVVADGSYIGLEEAISSWVTASHPAPGQFPHPMAEMNTEQLTSAQSDFEHELEQLNSKQGIWNDMTVFYVFGEK